MHRGAADAPAWCIDRCLELVEREFHGEIEVPKDLFLGRQT